MEQYPMKTIFDIKTGQTETVPFTAEEYAELEQRREAADLNMSGIRSRRNSLLSASDWTQLADSPLDDDTKSAWATYRQELRDLTTTYSRVSEVVWPTPPS